MEADAALVPGMGDGDDAALISHGPAPEAPAGFHLPDSCRSGGGEESVQDEFTWIRPARKKVEQHRLPFVE